MLQNPSSDLIIDGSRWIRMFDMEKPSGITLRDTGRV